MDAMTHTALITPVYNDWPAFERLCKELKTVAADLKLDLEIFAINDGSDTQPASTSTHILNLTSNQGHQRAIAVGLSHVAHQKDFELVIVMDSDGEDRPQDLKLLLAEYQKSPEKIVVAERKKRKEGPLFKTFYQIYRFLFRTLTGHWISFGNFTLIPSVHLKTLTHRPSLWSNFPGTIINSRLPYTRVATTRGERYAGQSKMNFVSLILHGLGAISVFSETLLVRILLSGLAFGGGLLILFLGLWFAQLVRMSAIGLLVIVLLQIITTCVFSIFLTLNYRTQRSFVPYLHYKDFLLERKTEP